MSRVRVRHGDDEIEVEGSDDFIESQLAAFYGRIGGGPSETPPSQVKDRLLSEQPAKRGGKSPAPAEFFRAKGHRADGVSQILIFGKYLEQHRNVPEFKPSEINDLVKQAKLGKDIHPQYFANAVKQGLLRKHPKGRYSLTLSAEELLASM
jgi:hypothetical protein